MGLVTLSVVLFLLWDGPLWSAPREASHVGRFVVSYLAVVPLAVVALAAARQWSWGHLVATTGSAWAIKMVITAVLYEAFATGTAGQFEPRPAPKQTLAATSDAYRPASGDFASGRIHGTVRHGDAPVASAVVYLDRPAPGRPLGEQNPVKLELGANGLGGPLYVASRTGGITASNTGSALHTVHLFEASRSLFNAPIPPSASRSLKVPRAGLYQLRCDPHPAERAWLLVMDSPYVTTTNALGQFSLDGVPAGEVRVVALGAVDGRLQRVRRSVEFLPGAGVELTLDLSAGPQLAQWSPSEPVHP